MTSRLSLWVPVVVYMAVIFALSSISNPPSPPRELWFISDKTVHIALYAGLASFVVRALAGGWGRPFGLATVALTIVVSTLYGVTDEAHQYFVPPRQMDALDLAADAAGATLASVGLYLIFRDSRPAR